MRMTVGKFSPAVGYAKNAGIPLSQVISAAVMSICRPATFMCLSVIRDILVLSSRPSEARAGIQLSAHACVERWIPDRRPGRQLWFCDSSSIHQLHRLVHRYGARTSSPFADAEGEDLVGPRRVFERVAGLVDEV